MQTIDYKKYENMSQRQMFNSLASAQKRVEKLTQNFCAKIDQENQLIDFLKSKMSETLQKMDTVTFDSVKAEYESFKKTLSPEKIAQIRAIKTAEMNAQYHDE